MDTSEKDSFPVWVGSLAESVNEPVLMMHFKRFGHIRSISIIKDPITGKSRQFGYVNYSNQDSAERAANEMNNVEVCGKKIKAKGPHEQPIKSPENKMETINLTDCYFFTQFGKCVGNHGKTCQYRHYDLLQKTKVVCPSWANRSCTNLKCPKLHPSQRQYKENNVSEIVLERCKSHNAFKCYGQCGKTDCEIHFNDERKLYDHITEGKQSLSPCKICNAVFFNKDDMERHSHPEYSTKYGSTPKLNSVDAAVSNSGINAVPIGVFWDIENCQIPKNKSALAIVKSLRDRYYPGRKEAEFICVCDTKKEKREVLEDLNKAQVSIVHINASSKNTADDKLKQALRRFAQSYQAPATILLVSGDINFAADLSDLRYRYNFHVILVHNKQASEALLQYAHERECFDVFTNNILPHTPSLMESEANESNQLVVFNLPHCKSVSGERITKRLNMLTQNTGGRVIKVNAFKNCGENKAIINFPDVDCARRALQRINNENVFGCTINVFFHFEKNKSNKKEKKFQSEHNREHKPGEIIESVNLDENHANELNKPISSATSGVYTNLKKYSSPSTPILNSVHASTPILNSVHGNIHKRNKVLNKQKASKQYVEMPPFVQNKKQNDASFMPLIIPPLMGVLPYGVQLPSAINVNPLLPNDLPFSNNNGNFNKSGVTIHVSNLDKSIDFTDIKNALFLSFRRHSNVLRIAQGQCTNRKLTAFVTVANMKDAKICISKLNNIFLFNHKIKLSLANNIGLDKTKENVKVILSETFSGWLPLQEFISKYKIKYEQPFHVLNLELMKDLIYIDGKPGHQFICLLSFPVGFLTIKPDNDFQGALEGVLLSHNRKVPFASLPGLYWSYLQKSLPLCKEGAHFLNHVLSNNITLVGLPGSQAVFHTKSPSVNGYSLSSFQSDIILLLKMSPKFEISWSRFIPLYHQFFGREICDQGFKCKDLEELIYRVSEVVQFDGQNSNKVLTFTRSFKLQILNEELDMLLTMNKKVNVSSLSTTYYRFFGRKFVLGSFGFNSLQQLLSTLQPPFKVIRIGDEQILSKVKAGVKKDSQSVEEFAEEIISIIKDLPEKRVPINNLSSEYRKKNGRQLKLNKLGFRKLGDLVDAISGLVKVEGVGEAKYLSLLERNENNEHHAIWDEITLVIKKMPYLTIMVSHLPNEYNDMFKKPFPIENLKTSPFLDNIPSNYLSIGAGSNRVLMIKENYPCRLRFILLQNILYTCERFSASSLEISNNLKKFGWYMAPERVVSLFQTFTHTSFTVCFDSITLKKPAACKMFEHDIIRLLHDESDLNYIKLDDIVEKYKNKFHRTLNAADFGYHTVRALCENLTGGIVVIKDTNNENLVELGPLGKVYFKCKSVVDHGFHHGALLFRNFATEYHKMHGTQIKLADYGFNKIIDLINCFDQIFLVHNEKDIKLIISIDYLKTSSGFDQDFGINLQSDQLQFDVKYDDSDEDGNSDLLEFDDDDDKDVLSDLMEKELKNPLEWWMEPLPSLSETVLQPELSQSNVVYDLIPLHEFDDNQDINDNQDLNNDDLYYFDEVCSVEPLHSHKIKDFVEVHKTPIKHVAGVAKNLLESNSFQSFDHYGCLSGSSSVAGGLQENNSIGANISDKISMRPKLAANFSKS